MKTKTVSETKPNEPKRQHAGIMPPGDAKRKPLASMTEAEREAELESIRQEINRRYRKIQENEKKAGTLLRKSLEHARKVGNLLARVKSLLPHGKYQEWVKDWFDGGPSTARTYKQIATHWEQITWHGGKMKNLSVRQALSILEEKVPPGPEYSHEYTSLMGQFERMITEWPGHVCERLAADWDSLQKPIEDICRQRYRQRWGPKRTGKKPRLKVLSDELKQAAA